MNEIIRVYADTSVFGGFFDNEFDLARQKFFDQVKRNEFKRVTPAVVYEEIQPDLEEVRLFL
jgi:hypothetical protein